MRAHDDEDAPSVTAPRGFAARIGPPVGYPENTRSPPHHGHGDNTHWFHSPVFWCIFLLVAASAFVALVFGSIGISRNNDQDIELEMRLLKDMILMMNVSDAANMILALGAKDMVLMDNVTALVNKDMVLMDNITALVAKDMVLMQNVSDLASLIAIETAARLAKDMILMQNVTDLDARLAAEELARAAKDMILMQNVSDLDTRAIQEEADRIAKDMILMQNVTDLKALIDAIGGLVGSNVTMKLTDLMMGIMALELDAFTHFEDGYGTDLSVSPTPTPSGVGRTLRVDLDVAGSPTISITPGPSPAGTVTWDTLPGGLVTQLDGEPTMGPTWADNICGAPACIPTMLPTLVPTLANPTNAPTLATGVCAAPTCAKITDLSGDSGPATTALSVLISGGTHASSTSSPTSVTIDVNATSVCLSCSALTKLRTGPSIFDIITPIVDVNGVASAVTLREGNGITLNPNVPAPGQIEIVNSGVISLSGDSGSAATGFANILGGTHAVTTSSPTGVTIDVNATSVCALCPAGSGLTSLTTPDVPTTPSPLAPTPFSSNPIEIAPTPTPGTLSVRSRHHLKVAGVTGEVYPRNDDGSFTVSVSSGVTATAIGGASPSLFLEALHLNGNGTLTTLVPNGSPTTAGSFTRIDLNMVNSPSVTFSPTPSPLGGIGITATAAPNTMSLSADTGGSTVDGADVYLQGDPDSIMTTTTGNTISIDERISDLDPAFGHRAHWCAVYNDNGSGDHWMTQNVRIYIRRVGKLFHVAFTDGINTVCTGSFGFAPPACASGVSILAFAICEGDSPGTQNYATGGACMSAGMTPCTCETPRVGGAACLPIPFFSLYGIADHPSRIAMAGPLITDWGHNTFIFNSDTIMRLRTGLNSAVPMFGLTPGSCFNGFCTIEGFTVMATAAL